MKSKFLVAGLMLGVGGMTAAQAATQITIATVNNPQMVEMQKLTPEFEKKYPNIKVNWDVMPENELRRKVTVDISTQAGSYDIVTLGALNTPIWAKNGWIEPFNNLPKSYHESDLIKPVRKALSYNGHLYALPFYAESSFTYYRKDLFKKAGLSMPEHPTWKQIGSFAKKLNDPANGVNGICLRGMPGWGENMALFDTMVNTFGGRWFNNKWQPELTSSGWHNALSTYVNLLNNYGPSGSTSNGFVEVENLFANGHCAMWVDATSGAGYISDPDNSKVANKVGFAWAPVAKTKHGSHWLWSWALAIPKDTQHGKAARKFVEWATSKAYIQLVGHKAGWVNIPPGTRYSTYKNPHYQKAASAYAQLTKKAINQADPNHPTLKPVPYTGVQFVAIPQFQALGHQVGQNVAAVLAGQMSVDQALQKSQKYVHGVMQQAGYYKNQ
ncbi:sugar ABC transporter substrate-binding protein [Salinisphaera sp. LB1]|uniref:ABC transporter substrate-binding protein n=1 Tax=Salinisphaera sp. LB1 TaxID=2183911 RepID=UPI000D707FD0|nr:sugar ABC transporter substrate-binding protein [Salinisphaera sp. LB1]AWN16069.1 Various polyols ABC transporter, periplasmic substrate-binding protein [Salinisphaera sp. LB1]